ncbi:MAG: ferrochelatase [Deltaproteobacteria bacterium]|nr:ferrochelatase [Deltaproteobacteria bacterium]MBW2383182.1 ferrochelatase [Deltaproteobacteria bacterium]
MPTDTTATGVLLVNLGTPDSPTPRDVRRYLREFLSDPRVLSMPAPARWLLLNAIILPTRPKRSAHAYAQIWTDAGSPLLQNGIALRDAVADELGDRYRVELAMRYGQPDVPSALERLLAAGVRRATLLPLFPQYSEAATGSVIAHVETCRARRAPDLSLETIRDFHTDPGFIRAVVDAAQPTLSEFQADHLLLSFHGLPESQVRENPGCLDDSNCCSVQSERNRGCYRAQCFASSRALTSALGLEADGVTTSFQSRMGRARWIQPASEVVIRSLAERGVRRLAVLCPAFVADCLETLEEIGIRLRATWQEVGGEELALCPCPNAHPTWVRAVADLVRTRAKG